MVNSLVVRKLIIMFFLTKFHGCQSIVVNLPVVKIVMTKFYNCDSIVVNSPVVRILIFVTSDPVPAVVGT